MSPKNNNKTKKYLLWLLFIFGFILRVTGINWDQGQHLHPDERFLTMVETAISPPSSIKEYFNTAVSPLNPSNYPDYKFYVYGTFPIFLVKYISLVTNQTDYNQVYLIGRILSALFDSFNIILLYYLSLLFFRSKKNNFYPYLPSFFYASAVLPLQLSHFFTVDTFLVFFVLATFTSLSYWLIKKNRWLYFFLSAVFWGLALSSKISAILFLPIVIIFLIYNNILFGLKKFVKDSLLFIITSFVVFRIFQPYTFDGLLAINPIFLSNMQYLKSLIVNRDVFYPPEIQWLSKTPLLFSLKNTLLWGLGLPFSLIFILLIFINLNKYFKNFSFNKIKKIKNKHEFLFFVACFWVIFLFIEQGFQFTATMRYFLPIYPFIFLVFVRVLNYSSFKKILLPPLIVFHLVWAILFFNIYLHPHSRVQASEWIKQNIPQDKILSSEYWDDALPLGYSNYQNLSLSFYDPDTPEKWQKIDQSLDQIDYLIMSSNRLWASIPQVPNRYPLASKFYNDLFSEKLNFTFIKRFTSYPGISLPFLNSCFYFGPSDYPGISNHWFEKDSNCSYPGIYLRDDTAEEAFTVYDHPQVLIFRKK